MKLSQLLTETKVTKKEQSLNLDIKGRVQLLTPELKGSSQCPYWKYLKSKISGKDVSEEVRIPKVFVLDTAKRFKVPLDPSYSTPVCIGGKTCAYFNGLQNDMIDCSFGSAATPKAAPAPQQAASEVNVQPEKANI